METAPDGGFRFPCGLDNSAITVRHRDLFSNWPRPVSRSLFSRLMCRTASPAFLYKLRRFVFRAFSGRLILTAGAGLRRCRGGTGMADPGKSVFEVKSSRTSPLAGGSGWRVTLREVKPMAWPPLPTAEVLCYDFSPLPGPGACWPNASPAWFSCSLAGCSDNFPEWPVFSPLCMRDKPPRKLYGTAALPCSPSKN